MPGSRGKVPLSRFGYLAFRCWSWRDLAGFEKEPIFGQLRGTRLRGRGQFGAEKDGPIG